MHMAYIKWVHLHLTVLCQTSLTSEIFLNFLFCSCLSFHRLLKNQLLMASVYRDTNLSFFYLMFLIKCIVNHHHLRPNCSWVKKEMSRVNLLSPCVIRGMQVAAGGIQLGYDKHNEDSLFRTLETAKSPAPSSVLLNKLSSLLLPS